MDGGTYVLVSGQDLNAAQRTDLEDALRSEATAVLRENGNDHNPRTQVWDAQTLAMLSSVHLSPAVDIGLDEFEHAQTLTELQNALRSHERPFQSDVARDEIIARIRERAAAATDDSLLLMVHGDAGAGKTRTVAEALDTDDLRDAVLYVNGSDDLAILTTRIIRNRQVPRHPICRRSR